MPGYYNPYTLYPVSYANQMGYANNVQQPMQQSYAGGTSAMIDGDLLMKWVDGEVGAKAFQMPTGWPANKPIPLWDSTDTIIWVKSWGPMGIPNPMQKLKYEMENVPQQMLTSGNSGSAGTEVQTGHYVTKDDLESMKREIMEAVKAGQNVSGNVIGNNQNGNGNARNNGNRGGNQ